MTDKKTNDKETNRFARRTLICAGLMEGRGNDDATVTMAENGMCWELTGNPLNLETRTFNVVSNFMDGEELPTGLTTSELQWFIEFGSGRGLEYTTTTEEVSHEPTIPFIESPILFWDEEEGAWSFKQFKFEDCMISVTLNRSINELKIIIEGGNSGEINNADIDVFLADTVKQVRQGLVLAGFEEGDVVLDCEVILGAERMAKCDPDFMRSLLTGGEEE